MITRKPALILTSVLIFLSSHSAFATGATMKATWKPKGSAEAAEEYFWATFRGQNYQDTPTLFLKLYGALAENGTPGKKGYDPFTDALIQGRLGFTYLWIASEWDYSQTLPGNAPPNDLYTINQVHIVTGAAVLLGEGISPLRAFLPPHTPAAVITHVEKIYQLIQIAAYYIGAATDLVLDTSGATPVQLQNWTAASKVYWKTYPAVVTGFYSNLARFSKNGVSISLKDTINYVSYSRGFNFATPLFGHLGPHELGEADIGIMWRMIQLGADPGITAASVPGATATMKTHATAQSAQYLAFYNKYKDNTVYKKYFLANGVRYNAHTNPDGIWDEATPAGIVKASVASSWAVPFNFENNFMLLGDAIVATCAPGIATAFATNDTNYRDPPQCASWEATAKDAYTQAKQSIAFEQWPHKDQITTRLMLLEEYDTQLVKDFSKAVDNLFKSKTTNAFANLAKDLTDLVNYAQNKPSTHYPLCMTCHHTTQ